MAQRVIIFSHGFGVRFNSRGLLPDIAAAFADRKLVKIEYNDYDESTNTLTVSPLRAQADVLVSKYKETRQKFPDAQIDLICHSQGCVVAALAKVKDVSNVVFLAPPTDSLNKKEDAIKALFNRPGAEYHPNGMSILPRRDGSITHIPAAYWANRQHLKINEVYGGYIGEIDLTIVRASQDEVLGEADLSVFGDTPIHDIKADHNFTGSARTELVDYLKEILK